jgi:hypothetical protein
MLEAWLLKCTSSRACCALYDCIVSYLYARPHIPAVCIAKRCMLSDQHCCEQCVQRFAYVVMPDNIKKLRAIRTLCWKLAVCQLTWASVLHKHAADDERAACSCCCGSRSVLVRHETKHSTLLVYNTFRCTSSELFHRGHPCVTSEHVVHMYCFLPVVLQHTKRLRSATEYTYDA